MPKLDERILAQARELRREMTPPEQRLWYELHARRFQGVKFNRQHPIGSYIVDFAARTERLAIELDGDSHAGQSGYDAARTRYLESEGYRVVRFANADVVSNLEGVLEAIGTALNVQTAPPPDPRRGGAGELGASPVRPGGGEGRYSIALPQPDDFDAWRDAARGLLLASVPPDRVVWSVGQSDDLFAAAPPPPATGLVGNLTVPKAFLTLAQIAILHSDRERFAFLYTLLWRLQSDRALMADHADPLIDRLEEMAKGVRRDIHKMRAFVRFRELDGEYVAWFEPDHHIVRANAGFFVRRFATMRWSILTPEVSVHWDGETLTEGPPAQKSDAPEGDPVEEVWKTYYANIFNPARVKVGAMLREMPKKYWKNMPETALVPELLAKAQAREIAMVANSVEKSRTSIGGNAQVAWERLREEAMGCTRCDLYRCATQTVFGEGPVDAPLVLVGEQPGDQEDLAGHPFVGPAGQKLDEALADAGIDRARAYVTNAVKHFKFEQRGKRRIHSTPGAGEIEACRWWIDQERAILTPRVTVALGATAARSLFGKTMAVGANRGRALELPGGGEAWITVHPSFLLRVDPADQADEYAKFVDDLRMVKGRIVA